jgi:multidrug efflux system membrane fusion protein
MLPMAENYIGQVAEQMRAGHRLQVDAFERNDSTRIAQGTVLTLDNSIDTGSGTVKVRAQFPNTDNRLFPNEFVNARILVKTLKDVSILTTAALQRNNDASYVYVLNPDTSMVKSRPVTVLTADGTQAAVTGVQPDETVITDGFDKLQDGTKVAVRQPRATADNAAPKTPPSAQQGQKP